MIVLRSWQRNRFCVIARILLRALLISGKNSWFKEIAFTSLKLLCMLVKMSFLGIPKCDNQAQNLTNTPNAFEFEPCNGSSTGFKAVKETDF